MINNNELVDFDSLPLGYRFRPTDFDLLFYLNKKVGGQPLPPNNIIPLNLYAFHPQQLAGEKEGFFFTQREKKYTNGKLPKRCVEGGDGGGGGYWKATGAEKEIIQPHDGKIIGYKRSLVFYSGTHLHGLKTNWIMHEYRVVAPPISTHHHHDYNKRYLDEWVLCRVYKNNRRDGGDGGRLWAHGGLTHVDQIDMIPDYQLPPAVHLHPINNVDEDEELSGANEHPVVVEEHAELRPPPPPPTAAATAVDGGDDNKNGADVLVGETTTTQQQLDDELIMHIATTDIDDGYTDLKPSESEDYITIGDDIWE